MSDGKKPKFPLPRGYFGDVHSQLSKEQVQYYREFCENQVQRGLLDERSFLKGGRRIDPRKWKPVRSQHNFRLFRRRDGGLHENDGKPSMIGVGRVEGSIEDVIYGAYDQTDEELRMTAELVEVDFADGIVLSNMEQGSETDPYRYLGIKWMITPFPMPALMPDRDWLLLESMGITTDANGRRYGYHTLFTIEMPQCPPFPEVIRGTMWYTFIYRDAGRGMIDVHSQGYFDCLGELLDPLTIIGSTQMFHGVFRYMKSAEAKKLTILALENLERKIANGEAPMHNNKDIPPHATCSVCTKSKSSNPFSSRRMRVCGICDAFVCLNCRVKKNILVGRQRVQSKVSACQRCIAHAKTLSVHPSNEKYVISREMQVGGSRGTAHSTASSAYQQISSGQHFFGTLMARQPGRSVTSAYSEDGNMPSARHQKGYYYDGNDEDELPSHDERATRVGSHGEGITFNIPASAYTVRPKPTPTPSSKTPKAAAPPPPPQAQQEIDETEAMQQALFKRMLDLQNSAKRARELTEANRAMMMETTGRA